MFISKKSKCSVRPRLPKPADINVPEVRREQKKEQKPEIIKKAQGKKPKSVIENNKEKTVKENEQQ